MEVERNRANIWVVEMVMKKMIDDWQNVCFVTTKFKDTENDILASAEEIQSLLDDHITKTQSMKSSLLKTPFEKEIKSWEAKMLRIQDIIGELCEVQHNWMYLQTIFASEDINGQLPEESELFISLDQHFKEIMKQIVKEPHVLPSVNSNVLLDKLQNSYASVEKINKGLNTYLDTKRLFFPRFFFLSNEEMLEILLKTKEPSRVQPHLKKCFQGIDKLEIDQQGIIYSMLSNQNEKIKLSSSINTSEANGAVEKWLLKVQEVMKISIRDVIEAAHAAYPNESRANWIQSWPGQIVLCVSQILWTKEVTRNLQKSAPQLEDYLLTLNGQLQNLIQLVRSQLCKMSLTTLRALIVIDVHARDVVSNMIEKKVSSENDFQWLAQLRYYWEEDNCKVRMATTELKYCYEYLGNTDRLVLTPLSDRCYLTLVEAFKLNLAGSPQGPAGTGKGETIKDLAKALGVQCIAINCSDQLDCITMAQIFKGVATAGSWVCFDEFNRIGIEVLSVVAQQMTTIHRALRAKQTSFNFEGTELNLNPQCYVCATLNPGYAGRTTLPTVLKNMFRPIVMMIPDYALISEISLYSSGFMDAKILSHKIVTFFKLCSELTSSQDHYDYGMRAVKNVITAATNLRLKYPNEREETLVVRSIVEANLPKFLAHDVPVFNGIISNLFPGFTLPKSDYEDFYSNIKWVCAENNLQVTDYFLAKITQMYDIMKLRHGLMLIGEPFAGKTKVREVLCETLTLMCEKGAGNENRVSYQIINPKMMPCNQLYGEVNPISKKWSDGVLTRIFRSMAQEETSDRKWLILDGPIDAIWVENLNSVLDDNKKLSLANNEHIEMSKSMSVIFETQDLAVASPATVSRCGMIYLEPKSLTWRPMLTSYINGELFPALKEFANDFEVFFVWLAQCCIHHVRNESKELVATGDGNLIKSMICWVQMLMQKPCENQQKAAKNQNLKSWLFNATVFGAIWSIGATSDADSRIKFDELLRKVLKGKNSDYPVPEQLGSTIQANLPENGIVYDYFFEMKNKGEWCHWNVLLEGSEGKEVTSIHSTIVPTIDTVRTDYLIDFCLKHKRPLLICGPIATGKSSYIRNFLMNNLNKQEYMTAFMTLSAQTTANQLQETFMTRLHKRGEAAYGPLMMKKGVFFVDDINMPKVLPYGAQPAIELLRMYMDQGYWYDRKDTSCLHIQDIQLISAMGQPGGGRNSVTPRFLKHFNFITINQFSDETMTRIFSTVMANFSKVNDISPGFGSSMVQATLQIYNQINSQLLPTPSKFHYLFNLRDFARVIHGCCLARSQESESNHMLLRLWAHETMRVFHDRLINDIDRLWFIDAIKGCVKDVFKEDFDSVFEPLAEEGKCSDAGLNNLMFSDFMNHGFEERPYEELKLNKTTHAFVKQFLDKFNDSNKNKLDLVISRYTLEHLSRISRVLRSPAGSALLIGADGSGRKSLTRLATAMAGYQIVQPEITKIFYDWREQLKSVLRLAGAEGKPTVLLLTESQIKDDRIVADIDCLLKIGQVPNLFSPEECAELQKEVAAAAVANAGVKNTELTSLELFAFFVSRCRDNLHVILTVSSETFSETFRERARNFPSLINCCEIDWFQDWPDDTLEKVAQKFLSKTDLEEKERQACVDIFKYFHVSSANLSQKFHQKMGFQTYVTPTSYKQMVSGFIDILMNKRKEVMTNKNQCVHGLEKLANAESQVNTLRQDLVLLQKKLDMNPAKNENLKKEIDLCSKRFVRAKKLTDVLSGENARWTQAVKDLQKTYNNLLGDALISSGIIGYLGPFTAPFRDECITDWIKVIKSKSVACSVASQYSLSNTLVDPIKSHQWHMCGLPEDSFSIQNAFIMFNSKRWPLIIDPQGQANRWLKNLEKENNLVSIKLTDTEMMRNLENSIQLGYPVLLEDVDEDLSPLLEKLLLKYTHRLGNNVLEYNRDIRVYMTTKLRNPHYLHQVATKVNLLNFTVTSESLADQLLHMVVAKEYPELEKKRQGLILMAAANKKALANIEENTLSTLENTEGSMLDNEILISTLELAKVTSEDMDKKQQESQEISKRINSLRLRYKPLATHSSSLFFCLTDLSKIDPMYQYSLQWFLNLYLSSISNNCESNVLQERLDNLKETFTYTLYSNVCRSLFKKDKLLFSFVLCSNLMIARGEIDINEYIFLLTGGFEFENKVKKPTSSWLTAKSWNEICRLSQLPSFKNLHEHFQTNPEEWKPIFESQNPQLAEFPGHFNTSLDQFQKMVVIRCVCPDKITLAITEFVKRNLGGRFIDLPEFELAKSYAISTCTTPLVFILTPDGDSMTQLLKFAQDKGFNEIKFSTISLGQGTGAASAQLIAEAQQNGSWVCLQNCHCATSWMTELEKICENIKPENTHPEFRLWLTSEPSTKFPVTILQNGVKMINEAPTGLRMSLLSSYSNEPLSEPKSFDGLQAGKVVTFKRLLYGLCFFHAVVQERKRFGQIGFNMAYEFDETDLRISISQLQTAVNDYECLSYDAILYMTGDCNYGGRVTQDWDRRCLNTILTTYYNPQVAQNPKQKLSESGLYYVPPVTNHEETLNFIKNLPVTQHPEVFGMHANAEITKDIKSTKQLFDSVILASGWVNQTPGETNTKLMEICNHILAKLPADFDLKSALLKYPITSSENMNHILIEEMVRYNKLIKVIRSSIQNLQKALNGIVVMSMELKAVSKSLESGKVPMMWARASYASLKPLGSYFNDLLERISFIQNWFDKNQPSSFWISGFYFPHSFLTGVLQNYTNKYAIPIDMLTFEFQVMPKDYYEEKPTDGAYIYGLFVEGARWDRNEGFLAEQLPKALHDRMPIVWIKPVKKTDLKAGEFYDCPVYRTSERKGVISTTGHSTNFVMPCRLNTKLPAAHWIKRGVALLCSLDD